MGRRRARLGRLLAETSVGTLLAATIGLVLVLAVVGIGLALVANSELELQRKLLLDQVGPSVRASLALENALINQETGIRGYVLTGEPRFLQPYHDGQHDEAAAFVQLRAHDHADGPIASGDVEAVHDAVELWQSTYIASALAGADRRPRTISTELEGKHLFDSVRSGLTRLQQALQAEDTAARTKLNSAAAKLEALLIVAAVLILSGVLAAGVLLRGAITLPLARLGREARRVAGGEFANPLDTTGGAREITEVGSEIDAMRRRIVEELASLEAGRVQLQAQAIELQRSNAELEQFAYVASHDLQEPLRKIASFCQALQQRYGGQLDDRADQYIDFAVDGAKRMQALINDLLAFSRVGRDGRANEHVELQDALSDARRALAALLESNDARIEHGPLPAVRGDRAQLASLFQNLIGNAVKFRGPQAPLVRIEAERQDEMWQLSCSDNGIGIDPEYAERIFLIFQRLHTREAYDGSGIGLAMCRKIVEYHGGRIWLDPDQRQGARFCFTLPIDEEDEKT
ncbi:MAG TPA: ATP-binding protein [Solirubrobacteraceae bacterium]|nr:ATP-binding protein [Solirubrobacteraceae bacterium]